MSLTTGRGPLSGTPAGRFNAPLPRDLVYAEPFGRRVRGVAGGRTVVDSDRVWLVHRPGSPPTYAFPTADADPAVAEPEPELPDHVRLAWHAADAWYEEEERVSGHPKSPYHRVDFLRTRRHLRVEVAGTVLVDTDDTVGVYETALAPRLYVRRDQVRMDLLIASTTTTYCPYKGTASYWNAVVGEVLIPDAAWTYDEPLPESSPIRGMLSFYKDRATVVDGLPTTV
ncbi:MAG: DUF427 domain-containing protein, partial [Acidimicrobiales bacterium]